MLGASATGNKPSQVCWKLLGIRFCPLSHSSSPLRGDPPRPRLRGQRAGRRAHAHGHARARGPLWEGVRRVAQHLRARKRVGAPKCAVAKMIHPQKRAEHVPEFFTHTLLPKVLTPIKRQGKRNEHATQSGLAIPARSEASQMCESKHLRETHPKRLEHLRKFPENRPKRKTP